MAARGVTQLITGAYVSSIFMWRAQHRCPGHNRLNSTPAVATRYGRQERVYQGTIDVAAIRI